MIRHLEQRLERVERLLLFAGQKIDADEQMLVVGTGVPVSREWIQLDGLLPFTNGFGAATEIRECQPMKRPALRVEWRRLQGLFVRDAGRIRIRAHLDRVSPQLVCLRQNHTPGSYVVEGGGREPQEKLLLGLIEYPVQIPVVCKK